MHVESTLWLVNSLNAERLVALGGMYHWTAMTILIVGSCIWLVNDRQHTGSFWGDFKQLCQPLVLYAMLASGSVWAWNHVVAAESPALRTALRVAQIEEYTASEEAYQSFLLSQNQSDSALNLPDRETYRKQATAQVDWMLSGGVTLVLALLTYLFASVLLALVATVLLHHIWGLPRCRNVPSPRMRRYFKTSLWLFALTLLGQNASHAQRGRMNLPNFDARPYHFGFILSGNQSDFKFAVADSLGPTFRGVSNQPQGGFNMHLMASYTLTRHLRVRFVPGLSFQERALLYRFAGNAEQLERTSAVNLDVPLLIKWRTDRMTNVAAYALGGVKYLRDFQSQEDVRQEEDILG